MINIVHASYGGKDVTDIVESKCNNNFLSLYVSNSLFGDPSHGILKYLLVVVQINGIIEEYSIVENSIFVLPKLTSLRLGIFYSNNNQQETNLCIKESLKSIEKSSKGKADIITNVWNSLGKENPFIETISWTQTSSHLNQVLQILQCLYTALQINSSYKYVSFLEHDVLYPEGYFDYEDFQQECISNSNYIGLCKKGFQKHLFNHQPLSQITMKMDFAIKHFESIIPNALFHNNGCVEPNTNKGSWKCKNPSVHINHGRHFTSHFETYTKSTTNQDLYWGHHTKYSDLFVD